MDMKTGLPPRQGLYDPAHEHDACGVGFVAHIKGRKSHDIVEQGLSILHNLDHTNTLSDGDLFLLDVTRLEAERALKHARAALSTARYPSESTCPPG